MTFQQNQRDRQRGMRRAKMMDRIWREALRRRAEPKWSRYLMAIGYGMGFPNLCKMEASI